MELTKKAPYGFNFEELESSILELLKEHETHQEDDASWLKLFELLPLQYAIPDEFTPNYVLYLGIAEEVDHKPFNLDEIKKFLQLCQDLVNREQLKGRIDKLIQTYEISFKRLSNNGVNGFSPSLKLKDQKEIRKVFAELEVLIFASTYMRDPLWHMDIYNKPRQSTETIRGALLLEALPSPLILTMGEKTTELFKDYYQLDI